MSIASSSPQLSITMSRKLFALLGLALAISGSNIQLKIPSLQAQDHVLAWVNQHAIFYSQAARAADRLLATSYDRLNQAQQQGILQMLVDDELLLQRAESLHLANLDPNLRKTLVKAMIDQLLEPVDVQPITESALHQFYAKYRGLFTEPARIAIDGIRLNSKQQAIEALALFAEGARFTAIAEQLDADKLSQLPRSALPPRLLRHHLGASLSDALLKLTTGQLSPLLYGQDGIYLFQVLQRSPLKQLSYREAKDQVVQEYRRHRREQALQDKLKQLWRQADITMVASTDKR